MPDPNNIVLVKFPLVFMFIPKVANTSMKMAMLNSIGYDPKFPGLNHFMASAKANSHIFKIQDKEVLLREYKEHLKIAFVRNPLDRIVSCYRDKVYRRMHRPFVEDFGMPHKCSFERFIKTIYKIPDEESDQHFRSQYYELYSNGKMVPDFIGRFEEIITDWNTVRRMVLDKCGLKLPLLPHVNKSEDVQINVEVTPTLKGMILERYAKDFEVFCYEA